MTSTVLARKYRPRHFESMVGQGHVVQALTNALTQQRLHHAYLFTGTRGVGKTTVSRILAKSLNCVGPDGQGGITARPCGQCQPCHDIDSGRFVDYVELDAASNRGVEEITQLLDQSVYKPVVGRFKVYMIDEVHMLSSHAFNAMLKTLEEPPDYLKFVLATTDPQKVPVTVLSRCLQFNLRPMALSTIEEHLQLVLQQEAVDFEPSALQHLARAARGSMRDALSLTDQAIAYGAGQLQEAVVRQMLGAVDREHVIRLLQALALGDGAAMVQAVDGVRKLGLSASGTLDELVNALQHMAMVQAVPDLAAQDAQSQPYAELASRFAADETQLFYSLALQGRQELPLAPDEYAGLTMIVLRWLAFKPGRQVARPPDPPKAEGPTSMADAGPASTPPWEDEVVATVASVATVEQLPPMTTSELGDRWFDVVSKLQQQGLIAALVRELAMQAECVRVDDQPDGSRWTLRVERESLRHDSHRERLTQALMQLLGGQVQLVLESGAVRDTPSMREQAARARRQAAAEKLISQDTLVVALLDNYPGAKIVPGSVVPL
jgi:DNA polymerase III subunit gamma/tau